MHDEGDAVDRILLSEAGAALSEAAVAVTIDDPTGALTSEASRWPDLRTGLHPPRIVRSYADSAAARRAHVRRVEADQVVVRPSHAVDADLLSGADVVLLRLPKALAELDEVAAAVARLASPTVQLFAAGKVKHMARSMNDVLGRHFGHVRASLGRQKARVLIAEQPTPTDAPSPPRQHRHDDLNLTVYAYGGTFAGTGIDLGSRLLLSCFDRLPPTAHTVVDLGSGSGLLAVLAARQLPQAQVLAVDDSLAAVRSTIATARASDVGDRIATLHADRLESVDPASADLIVCNPPFHRGTARDSSAAYAMFEDAARVLRPGGELWVVYNSHLPYLNALRRMVGSSTVLRQNPQFTVVRSIRTASIRPGSVSPPSVATA